MGEHFLFENTSPQDLLTMLPLTARKYSRLLSSLKSGENTAHRSSMGLINGKTWPLARSKPRMYVCTYGKKTEVV